MAVITLCFSWCPKAIASSNVTGRVSQFGICHRWNRKSFTFHGPHLTIPSSREIGKVIELVLVGQGVCHGGGGSGMSATTGMFDEDGVRIMLLGNKEEVEEGLTKIDQHCRLRICARVRRRFPGLTSRLLAEVWQETLIDVWKAVQNEHYDADKSLEPWLYTIAHSNAIDVLRQKTSDEEALARVGAELRGTAVGNWWSDLDPAERKEVLDIVQEHIADLPDKQRLVIQVLADQYHEILSIEDDLPRAVSKVTGTEETVAAVKRALQEARKSIREFLQKKGYGIGGKP